MSRLRALSSVILGVALSAASLAAQTGDNKHYLKMRLVRIVDAQGFAQPIEVSHFLIPSDWKTEGGVVWTSGNRRCPTNIVQLHFRAVSPDGRTGFEVVPAYTWAWSDDQGQAAGIQRMAANNQGCDGHPLVSPVQYLEQVVLPKYRAGAKVLGTEDLAGVAKAQMAAMKATYDPLVQANLMRGYRVESGRVRLAYSIDGKSVEEWFAASITTTARATANSQAMHNGQIVYSANAFSVNAWDLYAFWAPQGKLDANAPLFATILASIRPNPAYRAAIGQFLSNMNKIHQKGVADRQKIAHDAQEQTNAAQRKSYDDYQAVQDQKAEAFSQTIRGVENWVDPTTHEKVELSTGYNTAWSNGKGEYLLVETPGWNPNVELKENWTEMQKPKP